MRSDSRSDRGRRSGRPLFVLSLAVIASVALLAVRPSLALSFEGGKQIIDNARVTVWDVIWSGGGHGGAEPLAHDTVTVALTDGPAQIVDITANEKTVTRQIGEVQYEVRGEGHRVDSVGASVPHDIVIEL